MATMAAVSEKLVKEYILMSRRAADEWGDHVIPVVQNGKFFEVYDIRSPEESRLLSVCERFLYLKVIRKQKLTLDVGSMEEANLLNKDGIGLPLVGEKQSVFVAGFQVESIKKYRDILIDKGYSILPILQTGVDNKRTVGCVESASMHNSEASSAVVVITDDTLHVARYDANLNSIDMVERDRPPDMLAALDDARSIILELGDCSEVEIHTDNADDAFGIAARSVFVSGTSVYIRSFGKRRKFLCDRRWLRRALETYYLWISRVGEDVVAKLGMREASVYHIVALVLLAGFLKDHDASIGEILPVPNTRSTRETARFIGGMSLLHIFDAPVRNYSVMHILSQHIHTAMGKRALRQRLATPSTNAVDIRQKLVDIQRGLRIVEDRPEIEQYLRGMRDLEHLSCKLCKGRTTPSDVEKLVDTCRRATRILDLLPDVALRPDDALCVALTQIASFMETTFDTENACDVFKKDDSAPPDLVSARKRVAVADADAERLKKRIQEQASRKIADSCVLQVKNGQTDLVVPTSYASTLRAQGHQVRTYAKDLCAVEDDDIRTALCECDDARNHMRQIHGEAFDEACSGMRFAFFDQYGGVIAHCIGNIDMLRGVAIFFERSNYCAPDVREASEGTIYASALRHPLVERLVDERGLAYVPNDVRLDPNESWLVYGVNSAGKSSLLKAVALAVYMAQCGLYVPAASMVLSPYETIALHIGGSDDIFRHQSTFVKELEQLRSVLRSSTTHGAKLLFLADELGNSTEDASAVKLVSSLMKTLIHRRTTVALATHMFALQENPFVQGLSALKNKHLAVSFNYDEIIFERKLRDGLPETRDYGCRIASLLLREDDAMIATMSSDYHSATKVCTMTGPSRYNRNAVAQCCDVCGHSPGEEEQPLQWHHIDEQHEADGHGRLPNGLQVHAFANLARVCVKCHHEIHHGSLQITEIRETDRGRVVVVSR
jgi:hypothetical protein